MNKTLRIVISTIEMLVGTFLTAAPFGLIIIPMGFVAPGVTGLAKVVTSFVPLNLSLMVLGIEALLLVLGYYYVGKQFVAKTLTVSLLFPAMLELCLRYPLVSISQDPMLCTIVAGVMLGVGAGLVLHSGASTCGMDIIAVILHKRFKLPIATVLNCCDALVIASQAIMQPLASTFYGIIVITISARIVGKVVTYGTGQSRVMIFSAKYQEIRRAIYEHLPVGLTFLDAESGYEKKEIRVIVSIVPYDKIPEMKRIIMEVDPTAFVVIDEVSSVLGKGYTLDKNYLAPEETLEEVLKK